ncbi:MAG: cytidylate kinase family protein [bacterium]|nr:cytidylate kinase family protein [bacterium]
MRYSKITISGKICSGKSTLFLQLEKYLKWPIVHTGQIFRDYVKKHNLKLDKAQEQNEELTKKIDFKVRDMLKEKGNLLADSWMAGIMADHFPGVLKILLICKDSKRYQRFAARENVTIEEASKRVENRQKNWGDRMEKIHKRNDFFDKKNYDLIIDTSTISSEEVFNLVLSHLK